MKDQAKTKAQLVAEIQHLRQRVGQVEQMMTNGSALAAVTGLPYHLIFEQAADGITVVTSQGHFRAVNISFCAMTGYTEADLVDHHLSEILLPENLAVEPIRFEKQLAGETVAMERYVVTKSGRIMPVEVKSRLMADGHVLGIVRDITRRKQMEASLREAQEVLERRVQERTLELSTANATLQAQILERERVELARQESDYRYRRLIELSFEAIVIVRKGIFLEINAPGAALLALPARQS